MRVMIFPMVMLTLMVTLVGYVLVYPPFFLTYRINLLLHVWFTCSWWGASATRSGQRPHHIGSAVYPLKVPDFLELWGSIVATVHDSMIPTKIQVIGHEKDHNSDRFSFIPLLRWPRCEVQLQAGEGLFIHRECALERPVPKG